MIDMHKIRCALMAAQASNDALETWVKNADGRDLVRSRGRDIQEGLEAYHRLSEQLRDGRKHIEPPDDFKRTACYCSEPTCSPPCSWCTDPARADDEQREEQKQ